MKTPPKILAIKYNAVGDMVNITPSLRFIRRAVPDATIDILTSEWTEPAIRNNPDVRTVIVVRNSRGGGRLGRALELAKLVLRLRREQYDAVIAYQKARAFALLGALLAGRNVVMYATGDASDRRIPLDEREHVIVNALNLTRLLLRHLGFDAPAAGSGDEDLRMRWVVTGEEEREASGFLESLGVKPGTTLIGCVPGGGSNPERDEASVRQWGVDHFRELVATLRQSANTTVLLFGTASDAAATAAVRKGNEACTLDLAGRTHLRLAAALLARCRVVITNDTGPMHIAGALGVPVVGIFGPTGAKEKLPPGDIFFGVQSGLHCSPCYYSVFKGCLYPQIECMRQIDVPGVRALVERVLAMKPAPPHYKPVPENIVRIVHQG